CEGFSPCVHRAQQYLVLEHHVPHEASRVRLDEGLQAGGGGLYSNVQVSLSVPQMPMSSIRGMTWSGSEIRGSSCSMPLTSRDPGNTAIAFMSSSSDDRSGGAELAHSSDPR